MPVEAVKAPLRPAARKVVSATYPRLKPKGPVGPDFFRRCPTAAVGPRQSAVERLEADKAKYVKSQQALSKPPSVRPPEMRQPLLSPGSAPRPTKRTPAKPKPKQEGVQLNLEHLSNLISDVNVGPASTSSSDRNLERTTERSNGSPAPAPSWSSPAKVRLKSSVKVEGTGTPAVGTIRRVDVKPVSGPLRSPSRPPQFIRQPLQPIPLHPLFPLRPASSHRRLCQLRATPSPLKPVLAPSKPEDPVSPPANTPVVSLPSVQLSPPSPAFTRLSSSSSRKRPSLTRSKSDMSDRFSRAGTELERFFNLCGLDPSDLQDLPGSSSDIVSLARFRSVSAPGSECAGSDGQDDGDDDDEGKATERIPYGVSVIERNARVIKWLYGIRQVKDVSTKNTNL